MARSTALIAKITPPEMPAVLHRERLYRLLDECRRTTATWATGPPGSGKTTLIASYLEQRGLPCLWYRLDDGDADLATFFSYLGRAVQEAVPDMHKPLPLLTPEHAFGISAFIRRYFEQVHQVCRPPQVLVFDNYQDAPQNGRIPEVMREAVSTAPPGARIIVISRDAPPPELSRLLAGSAMSVVGWEDIRFDRAEAEALITSRLRIRPPEETLRILYEKNDGWAAGLILSILSMKRLRIDIERLQTVPAEDVFEYFVSEVFSKTDRETQQVLLKTAFLPDMTAPMVARITGTEQGGDLLREMSKRSYFTFRRAHGGEPVYQYHPLFRDFLLDQAAASYGQDELHTIRMTAAALLDDAGRSEDAADLYRRTGSHPELARLILAHAPSLLAQGRHRTLLTWLSWIPPHVMMSDPWLLCWSSICHLPVEPARARVLAEQAYELHRIRNDIPGMLLSCYSAIGSICYAFSDLRPLDRWIPVLRTLLRRTRGAVPRDIELRALNALFVSLLLRQPGHLEIVPIRERLLAAAETLEDVNQRVLLTADVSLHYLWTGDHQRAIDLITSLGDASRRQSALASPLALTNLKCFEAMCHAFAGAPAACADAAERGMEIARISGVLIMSGQLMVHAVAGAICGGDLAAAAVRLRELESALPRAQRLVVAYFHVMSSWLALLHGDADAAFDHAVRSLAVARELGCPFLEAVASFGTAQVQLQRGELPSAMEHLTEVHRIGRAMKSGILEFMCSLSFARVALDAGRTRDARALLRRGLALGKRRGFFFHLFWLPPVMARTCAAALDAGIEAGYARELIRRRGLSPPDEAAAPGSWPWFLSIRTLGAFEVRRSAELLRSPGKVQQKPFAMLKALIVQGGRGVGVDRMMYLLWTDAEGDQAHKSCEITLHRLRRLLGDDRAVRLHEGNLSLDPGYCRVDAWTFERLFDATEALRRDRETAGDPCPVLRDRGHELMTLLDNALGLYRGPFLPADAALPWTVPYRENLRSKFIRTVLHLGDLLEKAGLRERAVDCFQRGLDVDCLVEEFYQRLMLCEDRLGQQNEARDVYHRCRSVLSATLGAVPSARTEEIYRSIAGRPGAAY